MPLRFYKLALALSVIVNVVLLAGVWAYMHFAATLEIVEEAIGFLN